MKVLIGTAVGALALGGLLVATTHSPSSSAQASQAGPQAFGAQLTDSAQQPVLVNCGDGRQPVIQSTVVNGQTVSRVECGPAARIDPFDSGALAVPQPQAFQAPVAAPVLAPPAVAAAPPVRERIVYRDRVVEKPVAAPVRTTHRTPVRTADDDYESDRNDSSTSDRGYRTADRGGYRTEPVETRREPRTWKKSAVIIGGSAAGGAAVGAVLGGSGGAKKGAVAGGIAGTIYDVATRNKQK